jgi:hypothetical protein
MRNKAKGPEKDKPPHRRTAAFKIRQPSPFDRREGKKAISSLCKILINSDQFTQVEALNDFVFKHALDASGRRHYW